MPSKRPFSRLLAIALAGILAVGMAASPASAKRHHRHKRHHKTHVVHRVRKSVSPAAAPTVSGQCTATDQIPTAATLAQAKLATLCLLNNERIAHGLTPLAENSHLDSAAQGHSDDMVARQYFEHTSLGGATVVSRVVASGYTSLTSSWSIGENIAWGTGSYATPAETMHNWMNSPGHRANILDSAYRDVGTGVAIGAPASTGGSPGATYTQDFGARG